MCGFIAFLSDQPLKPQMRRSEPWVGLLEHRGPDAQNSCSSQNLAMHFTRLSILDLSNRGMQPMRSACGRYLMVFNGEIVNFRAIARQYGLSLRSHSDSEVLLELYAAQGEQGIRQLRGMFSFVIFDQKDRSAVAYRDPFGIKPLYYAQIDKTLVLSSEIKPILRALGKKQPRQEGIRRFLLSGEIDDGQDTLWEGVSQVPAGYRLDWSGQTPGLSRYFQWDLEPVADQDQPAAQAEYYDRLLRDVQDYLYADVPVGVGLSGGFDSSLLAHLIQKNRGAQQSLHMFTRGYTDYEGNELQAAREVGERFGFEYHPVLLDSSEVPDLLIRSARFQEHPITSLAILAYHKLYAQARAQGVKVLLEGHGGDELWAGYAAYQNLGVLNQSQDGSSLSRNQQLLRMEGDSEKTTATQLPPVASSVSALTQAQLKDLLGGKLQRSLRFVDRASMEHSLEVRVPFLDTQVALPALRFPDAWKIQSQRDRAFVRAMATPHLGESVALRPKVPIQDPARKWLQGELKDYVLDLLGSELWVDAYVDVAQLKEQYQQFLRTPDAFDNLTFVLFPIFLESWYQAMQSTEGTLKQEATVASL